MTRCQWCPGYVSWTAVVGIEPYELLDRRDWISSADAPSGANGTKKWPFQRSENAGGATYEATPRIGRWKTADGTTSQLSPGGSVTRPVSARNARAFAVHSAYVSSISCSVGGCRSSSVRRTST